MKHIYLERHDPDKNLHRFYQLFVTPGIFGDWSLVREWGRRGSPGTVRKDWFDTEEEAWLGVCRIGLGILLIACPMDFWW